MLDNETIKTVRIYMNEYYNYAIRLGLIKGQKAKTDLAIRFNRMRIIIDSTLPKTANLKLERNANEITLLISPNFLNKSDYEISEGLFHDLTHAISRIEDSLYNENDKLIRKYVDTYSSTVRKMFNPNYDSSEFEDYNLNSPYSYTEWGFVLLDEAIAQEVAEEMLELKYGKKREKSVSRCSFAPITYYHDFSCYGIYQELALKFAKTLRGINDLHDLAVASFQDDFLNNLIAEHTESLYTYEALFKELSYLGFICFVDYNERGFLSNKLSFDAATIKSTYQKVLSLMEKGKDNRLKPYAYKKICYDEFNAYWI